MTIPANASQIMIVLQSWCLEQLLTLLNGSKNIFLELGQSAAEIFIQSCIRKFRSSGLQVTSSEDSMNQVEKEYLLALLDAANLPLSTDSIKAGAQWVVSPKLEKLLNFLSESVQESFTGLVFVKTRAEAVILPEILSSHPLTARLAVSTFVGESNSASRKTVIADLADVKNQRTTLEDLRRGRKNLVVSTNALEEGIDVSACNHVICFDEPANLRSFVQRRGRARREESTYTIMVQAGTESGKMAEFVKLEEEMKLVYQDDMRKLERLKRLEDRDSGRERVFKVEKTGYRRN